MKNRQKILIVLGVLIVITLSMSFAYFTSSVIFSGEGASVSGTTATVRDTEFVIEGTLEFNDTDIYPGHTKVSAIRITATGDNQEVNYNVIWEGINSLYTQLEYTVYKTTSVVNATANCEKIVEATGGLQYLNEECTISNIDNLGEIVSSGVITNSNEERKIVLAENETLTSTSEGVTYYYYVVIEYPNLDANQNRDTNGTFNGEVTVELYSDGTSGTHNVTTALGTLAVNDCEPNFGFTSEEADVGGTCLYNGQAVLSVTGEAVTQETCQTVYKVSGMSYMDSTLTQVFTYVGEATWDSTTSTCTYDGTTLTDFQGNTITNAEDCVEVYSFSGTNVSGVENVGSGTWGPISGGTGIYETQDEEGTSYYYRGAVENNYVKFANKYWRLVRINGNGSLRLIYSGDVATIDAAGKETILANGYNDADTDYTQIGISYYNAYPNYNDNAYVGFMYGTAGSSTYAETHANTNSSTIKTYLETWYNSNLASYVEYLDIESGFCNDRSLNSGTGTGTTETYYSAYNRIWSVLKPTLKCANTNDYFTIKNSNKGNKALTYPIGLLTVDEAMYAGGAAANNSSYYLYTGNYYWTMSPYSFDGTIAYVFDVYSDGNLDYYSVDFSGDGVRPVINVKTDQLTITGGGTISNPYVIS